MTLRQRLIVASVAVGAPLAIALFYAAEWNRLGTMRASLDRYVESPQFTDLEARCERDPGRGRFCIEVRRPILCDFIFLAR